MDVGLINYRSWLFRIFAWDALLPVVVVLVPTVLGFLFPNHRGPIEIAAVTLPITALFLRFAAGKRHIQTNQCGTPLRCVQYCTLCIGILELFVIDALLILSHVMPKNQLPMTDTELLVWTILIAIYLMLMAVAMYPGREKPPLFDGPDSLFLRPDDRPGRTMA